MKTEFNKYEKINRITKTTLSKPYHANIKQKNVITSYKKEENNNNSILSKKNLKQNKLNISKKLNLIKEILLKDS